MATDAAILAKVRKICLSFPGTKETLTWGEPHFRVGEKIFAGCGREDGWYGIGFKLEMAHAARRVKDPRFRRARYVGHKGWVTANGAAIEDWGELRGLIEESYRLIAPKKLVALLDEGVEADRSAKPRRKR